MGWVIGGLFGLAFFVSISFIIIESILAKYKNKGKIGKILTFISDLFGPNCYRGNNGAIRKNFNESIHIKQGDLLNDINYKDTPGNIFYRSDDISGNSSSSFTDF